MSAEEDRVVADRRRRDHDKRVIGEAVVEVPPTLGIMHEEKRALSERSADDERGLAVPVHEQARPDADQAVAAVLGELLATETTIPEIEDGRRPTPTSKGRSARCGS